MNVLYTGGVFASMYFDWENTSAAIVSQSDSIFLAHFGLLRPVGALPAPHRWHPPITPSTKPSISPVSSNFADVLPNLPNPVSPNKNLSAHYLVFDNWENPFITINTEVQALHTAGLTNLWVLVHNWQNGGYDNKYPNTLPANPSFGGDATLLSLSQAIRTNGYLFGLHENFTWISIPIPPPGIPPPSPSQSSGSLNPAWSNLIQSYEMKPTLAANYLTNFAPQIHGNYTTTASFLDVHSSVNPSDKVDYDATVTNAAMCREVMTRYRALAGLLRDIHQGPVSGEGHHHFLNVGYFDDVEAQLNSGGFDPTAQAAKLPLLVDFDLLKMHSKALVHGVGYYERFYSDTNDTPVFQVTPSPCQCIEYMATELAYGHGGFIPTPDRLYDYVAAAKLEQRHVFPAQALYVNATPVSILYHDSTSNDEVTVSDYIRRWPTTFASQTNDHYMTQVRVTYNNGVIVCINRHPARQWLVQLGQPGGNFNFNAVMNGTNVQWVGQKRIQPPTSSRQPTAGSSFLPPRRKFRIHHQNATSTVSLNVDQSAPGIFPFRRTRLGSSPRQLGHREGHLHTPATSRPVGSKCSPTPGPRLSTESCGCRKDVAQVSNLLCRRLPAGRAWNGRAHAD